MSVVDDDLDGELLAALMVSLPATTPAPALKDALMQELTTTGRFAELTARVAQLCDLGVEAAHSMLGAIDDATRWMMGPAPGVELFHIEAGPRLANAICGLVRITAGQSFPAHSHVGDEIMLVLQGGARMSTGAVLRSGQELPSAAGPDAHALTAQAGPDLVYLVVAHDGILFAGEDVSAGPNDPRM